MPLRRRGESAYDADMAAAATQPESADEDLAQVLRQQATAHPAKLVRLDEWRSLRTGIRPGQASVCAVSISG